LHDPNMYWFVNKDHAQTQKKGKIEYNMNNYEL
jgi:hypothetical protein